MSEIIVTTTTRHTITVLLVALSYSSYSVSLPFLTDRRVNFRSSFLKGLVRPRDGGKKLALSCRLDPTLLLRTA